jgi:hypothetical protein
MCAIYHLQTSIYFILYSFFAITIEIRAVNLNKDASHAIFCFARDLRNKQKILRHSITSLVLYQVVIKP